MLLCKNFQLFRIAEITKSLESLDDVIDTYADIKQLEDTEKAVKHLEDEDIGKDLYDDAFSVQAARGRNTRI